MTADTQATATGAPLRQRVTDTIQVVLPHVLGGAETEISEETRIMEELDLTSANTLELMLELEEELEIQVDVEEIQKTEVQTIGTLASYIAAHALTAR